MEESFENKLHKVDLIDIFDDIAAIDVSSDQVIQLCLAFSCKVNLKTGNVVYAVEEKYKEKLKNYKKSKRLKWLKVNLNSIIPHPEEKFLKWQQKHNKNKRINWIKRKLLALDHFNNETLVYHSEEPCCSHSLLLASERRLSRHSQERVQFAFNNNNNHETSSCSTAGNTSSESMQTVIASQPRNTQDSSLSPDASPLINFRNVSRSTLSSSSGELPSLCLEGAIIPNANEAKPLKPIVSGQKVPLAKQHKRLILPLLQESEGASSQEDAYVTFYQDMQVTSTQEFG